MINRNRNQVTDLWEILINLTNTDKNKNNQKWLKRPTDLFQIILYTQLLLNVKKWIKKYPICGTHIPLNSWI